MIRSTLAIAGLALRAAVRSRLVLCLVAVLGAGLVAIPLTIRGDGTLDGTVRVTLVYSLGFTGAVLALATLWAACRLIAEEIEHRQIRQLVVKPVHRFQIWLGKWLGLLAMNALLLGAVGAIVYGAVHWHMARAAVPEAEKQALRETALAGRRSILPRGELTDAEVHQALEDLIGRGAIPADAPHGEAFHRVRAAMLRSRATVRPGESARWEFDMPRGWERPFERSVATALSIKFHLSQYSLDRRRLTGEWFVGTEAEPRLHRVAIRGHLERSHRIEVPLDPETIAQERVVVTFVNAAAEVSNPAVFQLENNVELLVRESGFGSNLVRGLIILYCKIALLAALGLCASALFSFPVASFSAVALLLAALLVHYLSVSGPAGCGHDHGHGHEEESLLHRAGERIGAVLAVGVEPVASIRVLEPLSRGRWIDWKTTGRALALLLLLYPAVLGLVASRVLNRRELGLPGD